MSDLEGLTTLMTELTTLGRLDTVGSPARPPDTRIAREVEEFLDRYPFLRRDPGYVAFLQCYAGAGLTSQGELRSLDIYGFSDEVTLHITRGEGDVVENGLLTFADLLLRLDPGHGAQVKSVGCGFGFPESSDARWGVYRITEDRSEWYCETFCEWLRQAIVKRGRLMD